VKKLPNVVQTITGQIGPVMVVHTGPGLLGLAICPVWKNKLLAANEGIGSVRYPAGISRRFSDAG